MKYYSKYSKIKKAIKKGKEIIEKPKEETEINEINNIEYPDDNELIEKKPISQWKIYFNMLHYKLMLQNQFKKERKIVNKKLDMLEILHKMNYQMEYEEKELVATIKNKKTDEEKNIYLCYKKEKYNSFFEWWNKFFKYDGWVFFGNESADFKLLKIKTMEQLTKIGDRQLFGIDEKVGTHKNKPLFIIKKPFVLTLKIKDNGDLTYNPKSLDTYVNHATRQNLLRVGSGDFGEFLKKNILFIVLIGIVAIFLFTPQGQELLKELLAKLQNQFQG